MELDNFFVAIFSISGTVVTYWFFLMKKDTVTSVTTDSVDITVSGGYKPDIIQIPQGKTTKINFVRTDPSSCLEEVVLSPFKIRKHLPLNEKVTVEVTPQQSGEYRFECGMNMFHGKIIVR
jgi:plastocyanin domain-containing protein